MEADGAPIPGVTGDPVEVVTQVGEMIETLVLDSMIGSVMIDLEIAEIEMASEGEIMEIEVIEETEEEEDETQEDMGEEIEEEETEMISEVREEAEAAEEDIATMTQIKEEAPGEIREMKEEVQEDGEDLHSRVVVVTNQVEDGVEEIDPRISRKEEKMKKQDGDHQIKDQAKDGEEAHPTKDNRTQVAHGEIASPNKEDGADHKISN